MNKETEKILETFKKINEEYSLNTELDFEDYEIPNIYLKQFLDYITNLQEELDRCVKANVILDNENTELQNKITNLQERCEYLERSNNRREDEIMSLRDECVDGETYKSRCEKARGMIRFIVYNSERPLTITELNKVYNILGGDDND